MDCSWSREAATARLRRASSSGTASGGSSRRSTGTASRSTTSAGPTAIPGETPIPFSSTSRVLAEAAFDQGGQGLQGRALVLALGPDLQAGALGGRQQQDPQYGLAVHGPAAPPQRHPRPAAGGGVHE